MCFFLGAGLAAGAAGAATAATSSIGIGTALSAITSLASIPLSIMQSQAQHAAAMAEYNEKVRYRQEQYEQSQKTLNQTVAQQSAALESEKGKAQGELADQAIEAYAAESRATAAAAESGIVGLSVDNLIGDIRGKAGRFKNRVSYNAKVAQYNTENELKMAQRGQQARVNEIPIPVKPRYNAGLEIGAAVVSGLGGFASAIG